VETVGAGPTAPHRPDDLVRGAGDGDHVTAVRMPHPDAFIATAVYEDGAALERQESVPEVLRAMALFAESLVAPPKRTIFDASLDPTLV
jgi:hypothetical protein